LFVDDGRLRTEVGIAHDRLSHRRAAPVTSPATTLVCGTAQMDRLRQVEHPHVMASVSAAEICFHEVFG
jgi:hypothetical protein